MKQARQPEERHKGALSFPKCLVQLPQLIARVIGTARLENKLILRLTRLDLDSIFQLAPDSISH